ncbi:MAG: DUF2460 domain-containing protein [Sphingomonadaceae bacterium]|nr:DUF2460 domain-containing protein [Sphingomonadaceae bacterium]
MAFWLAEKREGQASDWIQRFEPRFWTVNFPRPMVASIITTAPDALRVDATFLREADLAGLIWESEDRLDHPLLAYETKRDYAHCVLSFRWQSSGIIGLDEPNGPTLTIEGRDAAGQPRTWYVRMWNYAIGTPENAQITLPFSSLVGGWELPEDADPVWPSDIDRIFISLAAPDYDGASADPLPFAVDGWAELSGIVCTGERAMLEIGDVVVPPHGHAIATGFDDNGVQTPARLLRNIRQLGYRGSIVHYVGMSHYFQLAPSGGNYVVDATGEPLCLPARNWHRAFFAECVRLGFSPIASLSYEVLDQHCPEDWKQRAFDGSPALTGWDPPSSLLSPANSVAMTWLQSAAASFVSLMIEAGAPVRFQVGEPWWWIFSDGRICLYDNAAQTAFGGSPPAIPDLRQPLDAAQTTLLDDAGAILANSTAALVQAARNSAAPQDVEALLLIFPPTLLDPAMPEARRANLPTDWASPAFDRLQVEDYDWLTAGADAFRRSGYEIVNQRLGYPPSEQDYFAGFVLLPEDNDLWQRIDAGIDEAKTRSPHEIFIWALPQVCRDGFVRLPDTQDDNDMQAFDDVQYPLALGRDATVIPEFSTSVSVTASGFERRNSQWSNARLRFDVGPGIRSEAELGNLIAFFRARRGAARGFRLRDPSDYSSNGMVGAPTMSDELLGTGDATTSTYPLIKRYGDGNAQQIRRVTRPIFETLLVSIDGVLQLGNWSLDTAGIISFDTPPATGAQVHAGFHFDVPVRFAQDNLEVSGASFAAGDAPSVPVVEIREAA